MVDRLLPFVPYTLIGGLLLHYVWLWPGFAIMALSLLVLYVRWFQNWRYKRRRQE